MKTKDKIFEKIDKGEIKMRPKWKFEMEKYGLVFGVSAISVLAGLTMLVSIWLIQIGVNLEILEFGVVGKQMLLGDIPWGWLAAFGASVGIGLVLFSKTGVEYRKTSWMRFVRLMFLVLAILITLVLLRDWFELELLVRLI